MHSKIFEKINKKIKSGIELARDDRIKRTKTVDFLGNHTLIISFLIFVLGVVIVFSAVYQGQTKSNTIVIDVHSTKEGSAFNENNQMVEFNRSYLPYFMRIAISINYKEPVMRGDRLSLNSICTSIIPMSARNVTRFDLYLEGSDGSVISADNGYTTVMITQNNLTNIREPIVLISEFLPAPKTCNRIDDFYLSFKEPNSNGEFNLSYRISYTDDANRDVFVDGKAYLQYPIRFANEVEAYNININRMLLALTGILIMLGSVPFGESLKNLLGKG